MATRKEVTVLGVPLRLGPAFALVTIVALAVLLPQPWHQLTIERGYRLVDLEVYRDAGLSLLHHRAVYDHVTGYPQFLPFTYPPTSALLAVPLALLPDPVAQVVWVVGCYLLLFVLVVVAFRSILLRLGAERAAVVLPFLYLAMAYLLPIRSVVRFGQVGLVLAVLCIADCMTPESKIRWPRGLLIGLAAAMKLTPAVFIPYLWLSGRRKAAYTAVASFVGLVGLTWAIAPGMSSKYWTDALFSSDRLGDNTNTSNQALRGLVLRMDLAHHWESLLWFALVAVIGMVGLWRASKASRIGNELAGVSIAGLLAVLLSPVAWIHHLVWVVLVVGVLVGTGRSIPRLVAAAAVTLVFSLSIPWWGDHAIFRHLPKSVISYRVPGAQDWTQLQLRGLPKIPVGTEFRAQRQNGTYRPLAPQTRNYLPACANVMERNCITPRHPGSTVWPLRFEQSAYTLAAGILVFVVPVRRPDGEAEVTADRAIRARGASPAR